MLALNHFAPRLEQFQTATQPERNRRKHTHIILILILMPLMMVTAPPADLSHYIHVIILSTDGFLYNPIDTFLTDTLKIPSANTDSLLKSLHTHAMTHALHTAAGIIRRSRQIDQSPDITLPPFHGTRPPWFCLDWCPLP